MFDKDNVGNRLTAIRKSHKLSQRKLAQRAGVANATISQIEAGKLNPTVSMLKKVLSGIPMSLSDFFSDDSTADAPQIFFSRNELTKISEGGVSYRQVGQTLVGRAIQLLHEKYAPGASTGRHALEHDGEECGIVLEGELTVAVGDKSRTLGPGEAYYFKSNQPHSFQNKGYIACTLISACSPPSF